MIIQSKLLELCPRVHHRLKSRKNQRFKLYIQINTVCMYIYIYYCAACVHIYNIYMVYYVYKKSIIYT